MRYEWTGWIEHTPGQELPAGLYVRFEFQGYSRNGGKPYELEGTITPAMRGHGCWYAASPGDEGYCMVRRYKIRAAFEEAETGAELEAA